MKSSFGKNESAYKNVYKLIDNTGVSIGAVCGGKISATGTSSAFGNYAIVDVGLGLSLVYSNLSSLDVSDGDFIAAGDVIGKSGHISSDSEGFSLTLVFDGIILDPNVLF